LPVKKTSDLLLVMSNLYSLEYGALVMSPKVCVSPFLLVLISRVVDPDPHKFELLDPDPEGQK
jgi:hypothetical protein